MSGCHFVFLPLGICVDFQKCVDLRRFISFVGLYQSWQGFFGYRISPEEVHGANIGYTWREAQQLVQKLTTDYPFDYIHYSTLTYKSGPTDPESEGCGKSLAELMNEAVQPPVKTIVAGWIYGMDAVKDALNYADIVGLGRMTLIDPEIGYKVEHDMEDQVYLTFTGDVIRNSCLTKGLRKFLWQVPEFCTPGMNMELLKEYAGQIDLGYSVLHTGTNDPQGSFILCLKVALPVNFVGLFIYNCLILSHTKIILYLFFLYVFLYVQNKKPEHCFLPESRVQVSLQTHIL